MRTYQIDLDDIEKRVSEIQRGLDIFQNHRKNVVYFEDAAVKIAGVYYEILKHHVRPLIPKKVSKFKMAAVVALTIVKLLPASNNNNEKEQRILNAELAFFLAMNLILDMANPDGYMKEIGIKFIEDSIKKIKDQHLSYLAIKERDSFPIFPIGSFYYCFFVIFQSKYNVMSS